MNIIVSNAGEVRFTQYSDSLVYDVNTIKLYISKDYNKIPKSINLYYEDKESDIGKYLSYDLSVVEDGTTTNYNQYKLTSATSIPGYSYTITIKFNDGSSIIIENTVLITNDVLVDEHSPLEVHERTIVVSKNSNILVAQDSRSQCITFMIKEKYDGISFLDQTKEIFVDFIPVGYKPDEGEPAFFSDLIKVREWMPKVNESDEQWILLKWIVPFAATKTAGDVTIALAVLDNATYIWQTVPTKLTVLPNIGLRPAVPVTPEGEPASENFVEYLGSLEDRIKELEEFDSDLDNISSINAEEGTITYTTRTPDHETETTTVSITDLWTAGLDEEELILFGGESPITEED